MSETPAAPPPKETTREQERPPSTPYPVRTPPPSALPTSPETPSTPTPETPTTPWDRPKPDVVVLFPSTVVVGIVWVVGRGDTGAGQVSIREDPCVRETVEGSSRWVGGSVVCSGWNQWYCWCFKKSSYAIRDYPCSSEF